MSKNRKEKKSSVIYIQSFHESIGIQTKGGGKYRRTIQSTTATTLTRAGIEVINSPFV